jgi:hypothetical protein
VDGIHSYNCLLHAEIVATSYRGGLDGGCDANDDREDVIIGIHINCF